ncbi:MAG TPA: HD domain-containing protein, partial [Spirochaetia bacterium]|nr:HD domain-containing protein [Spirochaetia bacterium]
NFDVAELRNQGETNSVAVAEGTADGDTGETLQQAEEMISELRSTNATSATGLPDSATAEEIKRYRDELEKQQALIRELQADYARSRSAPTVVTTQDSAKTQEILDNLVKLYEVALATREQPGDIDILAQQMREYRSLLQEQQSSQTNLVIVAIASAGGVVVLVIIAFLIIYLIVRKRRLRRFAYATDFDMGLGYAASETLGVEERTTKLLGYEPPPKGDGDETAEEGDDTETDVMKYMIRAERLKQLQNEKKYGAVRWETLRKYIGELEKDLRSDILYVVESKIEHGDVTDYSQVLPVLFPFLTDADDYLRDKARHLVSETAARLGEAGTDQEPIALIEERGRGRKSKDPLSLSALMKHVDRLRFTKTARREHCLTTAKYARGTAVMLGAFPAEDEELLYKAALVHDIGYLALDREKLEEVESKKELSDEEFAFIHQHPEKGVEYFKDVKLPRKMQEGILYHHERNDGSGYPKGLKKDEIPDFAKIIGIADAFDALTTNRVFRDKMEFDSAVVIMRDLGRTKFEPTYLDAFIEYLKKTGKIKR